MEAGGKIPTGMVPAGRSAVGFMLVDRSRRPSSEVERRQLSTAVSDRGWSLSVRFGPGATLAELCHVDREEGAREAWGLPRRFDLVLLIAGGVRGPEEDVFIRAVRAHAPRTRIHRWVDCRIVPVDDDDRPDGDGLPGHGEPGARGSHHPDDAATRAAEGDPPPGSPEASRLHPAPAVHAAEMAPFPPTMIAETPTGRPGIILRSPGSSESPGASGAAHGRPGMAEAPVR